MSTILYSLLGGIFGFLGTYFVIIPRIRKHFIHSHAVDEKTLQEERARIILQVSLEKDATISQTMDLITTYAPLVLPPDYLSKSDLDCYKYVLATCSH